MSLPTSLLAEIDAIAESEGRNRSNTIVHLLRQQIKARPCTEDEMLALEKILGRKPSQKEIVNPAPELTAGLSKILTHIREGLREESRTQHIEQAGGQGNIGQAHAPVRQTFKK